MDIYLNILLWIGTSKKGEESSFEVNCSTIWGKWISKPLLSVWNSCISLRGVENDLETCCLFVGVVFLVVNCALLSKWLSSHFHSSMSFALYLRHVCGKRMYHFEGRIARRDGYYISRDVSRAAKVTIIEGRVMRCDRCMDRYVPYGSRTERQRVCIVKKDMHHYIWHCISWHCTFYYWWTWTRMLLILWVFFCEACDCWILSGYWECVNW